MNLIEGLDTRRALELLEHVSDGFFILDQEQHVLLFNHAAARFLGRSPAEVLGRKLFDAFPEAKGSIFEEKYTKALRSQKRLDFTVYFGVHPYENWYEVRVFPYDGNIAVFFQVTTEHRRTVLELAESERRFRDLVENLPQTVFEMDLQGRFIFANKAGLDLFGYTSQEMEGGKLNVTQILAPEERDRGMANIRAFFSGAGLSGEDYIAVRRDGSTFPIRVYSHVIQRHGMPLGLRGIVLDMSEIRAAEARLEESERHYRSLFENNGTATCIFNEEGVITSCNREFALLCGYEKEEIEGRKHWTEFTAAEDHERMLAYHEQRVNNNGEAPKEYGFTFVDRHGNHRIIQLRVTIIPGTTDRIAAMQDVTDLKRAEDELERLNQDLEELVAVRTHALSDKTRQLEEANRRLLELDMLKDSFLSTVSHDIRTPLTSIQGFAKLINRDFVKHFMPVIQNDPMLEKKGTRITENIEIILHESSRLTRLVSDFLDLSKIEAGRMEWDDRPLNLEEVAGRALQSVGVLLESKPEVTLGLEIPPGLPPLVMDEDRLLQVLVNLLDNAVKFTENGEVLLEADTDSGMMVIRVSDNGPGIASDQVQSIFDKFHQARSGDTVHTRAGGSGMGLAICKQIVSRYGGDISVKSLPGKGSVFTVRLPLG